MTISSANTIERGTATGQTQFRAGRTFIWDGAKWRRYADFLPPSTATTAYVFQEGKWVALNLTVTASGDTTEISSGKTFKNNGRGSNKGPQDFDNTVTFTATSTVDFNGTIAGSGATWTGLKVSAYSVPTPTVANTVLKFTGSGLTWVSA